MSLIGAFGKVHKAKYKSQAVAVKEFNMTELTQNEISELYKEFAHEVCFTI